MYVTEANHLNLHQAI